MYLQYVQSNWKRVVVWKSVETGIEVGWWGWTSATPVAAPKLERPHVLRPTSPPLVGTSRCRCRRRRRRPRSCRSWLKNKTPYGFLFLSSKQHHLEMSSATLSFPVTLPFSSFCFISKLSRQTHQTKGKKKQIKGIHYLYIPPITFYRLGQVRSPQLSKMYLFLSKLLVSLSLIDIYRSLLLL